ncbi:MAG: AAC(3) family N-acetyltransferase [Erysipelotrichaceae bacterium]|nr:AAC(3) family N-acetyltransferase [Erysipelotrichaceae bacterium]
MDHLTTKQDWKDIFDNMGIDQGMSVCLQVNPVVTATVLGGGQAIIEALMETVTLKGSIVVPTFDLSTLDPSCTRVEYENWVEMRENMLGFKDGLTGCDPFGLQFLRNEDVVRSKHPVYSFAYWGSYRSAWLENNADYPFSFSYALWPMRHRESVNLLIGYDKTDSVLLPALAQEKKEGLVYVERAKVRRVKSSIFRSYLNIRIDDDTKNRMLASCHEKNYKWNQGYIHCLWVDTKSDKSVETSSTVSFISSLK